MKTQCKRCGWEIAELNLSEEQKPEIWGLINQDLPLFAIKKIMDALGVGHKDAKGIVLHF